MTRAPTDYKMFTLLSLSLLQQPLELSGFSHRLKLCLSSMIAGTRTWMHGGTASKTVLPDLQVKRIMQELNAILASFATVQLAL